MGTDLFISNGINGETGQSLFPPVTVQDLEQAILSEHQAQLEEQLQRLLALYQQRNQKNLGMIDGYDPASWRNSRWGVIYHPNTPPEVSQALSRLVRYRNGEEFNYQDGETAYQFRLRHGQDYGLVDPGKLPYYLLIVGSPADIPFQFQFDLDGEHAVGRLYFETAQEYENYARRVLAYETATQAAKIKRRPALGVFATNHDPATQMSAEFLARKIAEVIGAQEFQSPGDDERGIASQSYRVDVEHLTGALAQRNSLWNMFNGTSSLVFSASHGLGFSFADASKRDHQLRTQGAILCQDWVETGSITPATYLSGEHIPTDADLSGLIVLAFACFSAGTPVEDEIARYFPKEGALQLAGKPFVAYLPQRLLAQGALAWIGHVNRVWSYSYGWPEFGPFTGTFEETVKVLLRGKPVGYAMEGFNQRYLELNNDLTNEKTGLFVSPDLSTRMSELRTKWIARNDARGYIVFGDPAVSLNINTMLSRP